MIKVEKAPSPTILVEVELKQYEDRKVEEGPQTPFLNFRPSTEEPACYEMRTDAGYRRLNAGQMEKIARGLLDMSETVLKTKVYVRFQGPAGTHEVGPYDFVKVVLDELLDHNGNIIANLRDRGWYLEEEQKATLWESYTLHTVQT